MSVYKRMDQLDFLLMWRPWQPISKIVLDLYILPSLEPQNNVKQCSDYENIAQISVFLCMKDKTKELAN